MCIGYCKVPLPITHPGVYWFCKVPVPITYLGVYCLLQGVTIPIILPRYALTVRNLYQEGFISRRDYPIYHISYVAFFDFQNVGPK